MDGGEVAWLEGIQIETILNCAANCEKWVGLGDFWLLCFFVGLVCRYMQNGIKKAKIGH